MKYSIIIFLFLSLAAFSQTKKICVTVDDVPCVAYNQSNPEFQMKLTQKLINTFNKYKVPAIGFVNETQLYRTGILDSDRVAILQVWLKNGYELGNHTFSHVDYNKLSAGAYFSEIKKGEAITRKLMKEHKKTLTYFRHPYLHTGATMERADSLNTFLAEHHYKVSPVTVDNADYLFAKAYNDAYLNDDDGSMAIIGQGYVDYMEKKIVYFEQKSQEVFGRQIAQTLLIHANLLNADFMGQLLGMYKKHEYAFVSQAEVLNDPAYKTPVTYYTGNGISWLFRWAMSKGMTEKIMEGDIEDPKF